MNKALYNIGIYAAFVGIIGVGVSALAGWWIFFVKIVPHFWVMGNYWPAAIAASVVLLIVGSILVESNKESAN